MSLTVVVVVPGLKLSSLNAREHWSARARRVSGERAAVAAALCQIGREHREALRGAGRVDVRLVRLGGRKLDRDNLAGSFKGCLDEVAKWLRVDDGDEDRLGVAWAQEPGGGYGVRIELTAGGE